MEFAPLLLLPVLAIWLLVQGVVAVTGWAVRQVRELRARRWERTERELDRKAAELRSTIFVLAEQLSADAHEARKALIRESFLASGRIPPQE